MSKHSVILLLYCRHGLWDHIIVLAVDAADHSGRAVSGMNWLRSFERWDRGFEWMSVCVYSVFVLFFV
jgi:hypothetical protein